MPSSNQSGISKSLQLKRSHHYPLLLMLWICREFYCWHPRDDVNQGAPKDGHVGCCAHYFAREKECTKQRDPLRKDAKEQDRLVGVVSLIVERKETL